MTHVSEWFLYLLPLNLAVTYTMVSLARYIRGITTRPFRIKCDGIEVTAWSMADAEDTFAASLRVKEKYEA